MAIKQWVRPTENIKLKTWNRQNRLFYNQLTDYSDAVHTHENNKQETIWGGNSLFCKEKWAFRLRTKGSSALWGRLQVRLWLWPEWPWPEPSGLWCTWRCSLSPERHQTQPMHHCVEVDNRSTRGQSNTGTAVTATGDNIYQKKKKKI